MTHPSSDGRDTGGLVNGARRSVALVYSVVNSPKRLVLLILAIWVACSLSYAALEKNGGPIDGLWWGIVTGTTVGYGDYYPETDTGRVIASILIVSMIVLVPIAIGHVIARFVQDRDQFTHDEQVALAHTVASMHDRIEVLERLLVASLGRTHGEEWVARQLQAVKDDPSTSADVDDHMLTLFRREA